MQAISNSLISRDSGKLVLKVSTISESAFPFDLQKTALYSVVLVQEGEGLLKLDLLEHVFSEGDLICTAPYQPFSLKGSSYHGLMINFHPDFFCIHKHQEEIACNGVLFNTLYEKPVQALAHDIKDSLVEVALKMQIELEEESLAQSELLLSYLKIFLITASRSKALQMSAKSLAESQVASPFILLKLKESIETNYRDKHSPSEYAELLNISTKALSKITKAHFHRTLGNLINERIVIEAKRELYLTSKPVKTIAYELGFEDEFYFSRFFKNNTKVSPLHFRTHVGFARAQG